MTGILLCCAALIVLLGALYIVLCHEPWLAAHLRSLLHREPADNPYALDPVDEHFTSTTGSVYVKSDHPEDCAQTCCWEIRLTEMHDAFDWDAYEYEMRKTK
jgi:hypothetical protein